MKISIIADIDEHAFKTFLRKVLLEVLEEIKLHSRETVPEILNIKQAAEFLHLKPATLYEKTSQKIIPHFKKGNKLYFYRSELEQWVTAGKVNTQHELQTLAATHVFQRSRKKKPY